MDALLRSFKHRSTQALHVTLPDVLGDRGYTLNCAGLMVRADSLVGFNILKFKCYFSSSDV